MVDSKSLYKGRQGDYKVICALYSYYGLHDLFVVKVPVVLLIGLSVQKLIDYVGEFLRKSFPDL